MKTEQILAEPVLVLVLKKPRLGYGKQRLAATLGVNAAYEVAHGLLCCALEDAADWPGGVALAPSKAEDLEWAQRLLERPVRVVTQGEGNLGERLQRIDNQLRGGGARRILYMGSDSPALQAMHFSAAAHALAESEVVLSAADDGGVVLMGAAVSWPTLAQLPWSTEQLGDALRQACEAQGLTTRYIAPGYDIDIGSDLLRLMADLELDPRPARQRLRRLLEQLLASPGTVVEPRLGKV